jgi:predicted component of type VI protein secretion system
VMKIGRRADQDLHVPEPTVSGNHANLRWQAGSWLVEDTGSTNGTYADHSYERKKSVTLLHGAEVQLGECRFKLVSFRPNSPQHQKAREYLSRRDGLTGLLVREQTVRYLEDEVRFAEWDGVPLTVAKYEVKSPNRLVSDRPTILEMLALRRSAQRVIELTEVLLLSIVPVTAGRVAPLKFAVTMTGPSPEEAQNVVEQVVSQVQGLMPESLRLGATMVQHAPGLTALSLLQD